MVSGWAALGKPDFATCGKLFYRLPAELRESLNRSEERVLIWTLFLSWYQSFHSGRGSTVASFSETWLGTKFSRSRWTVARSLTKLVRLSLLKVIRRPPKKDGTFQTNLVLLTGRLSALLGQKTAQPREKAPCSNTAPQEVGNGNKRDKAASFESPPLVPSKEEEDQWKKESAGSANQVKASFFALLQLPNSSATAA